MACCRFGGLIERLRREGAKLKAERDILKMAAVYFGEGCDMKLAFIAKHT